MTGFLFPNEGIIQWDLLIVLYPFITGLVAGAFIVSSLYHVFGITSLKPVARFSLITALSFLIVTPLPLAIHLGRPERAFEMFRTPNLHSAMSMFGFIWFFYLLIVVGEVWLVFRPDIVKFYETSDGFKKTVYSILALGVYDVSEETLAVDHKIVKVLAFIGIPSAFLLHGYIGFIFGAVKANPWWSTPLMPIIFLMSATVSGMALLILLYVIVSKIRKSPIDQACVHSLSLWLMGFLTINVILEGLEVFSMFYESEESWQIISQLITQKIWFSYIVVQFISGAIVPLVVLAGTEALGLSTNTRTAVRFVSAALVLIGVFAMRWNVVIGGQLLSKSLRGFASYTPPIWGIDGIISASLFMALPFVILAVLINLIPPWQEEARVSRRGPLRFGTRA